MRIHRVRHGERMGDIAKEYGICEELLRGANEIYDEEPTEGEELLILMPTRTYRASKGDSMTRVSLRFGVPISELYRLNPEIMNDELREGQVMAVKRDERPYGLGVANGIYYKGCPDWKLQRALHYSTYITVGSGIYDGKRCYESFDGSEIVRVAIENGKLPLIRVYDKSHCEFCKDKESKGKFIDSLIYLAMRGGYRGIVLGGGHFRSGYEEFLVELRCRMIGIDMILITEILPESPIGVSDFSDGAILSCDKCGDNDSKNKSYSEYEEAILTDFANRGESTKTFLEVPTFAYGEDGTAIDTSAAIKGARRCGTNISINENTNICKFQDKMHGSIRYNSLCGIKRRLDLGAELGFMGISFDIARCPLSYLLTYDSLFKSVGYANVERCTRCNPDSAEANI